MLTRITSLVTLVLVVSAVRPSEVAAQVCGELDWCWESVHKMPQNVNGWYTNPHSTCNVCPSPYVIECGHAQCHDDEDAIGEGAVRSALSAASLGDVHTVAALAPLIRRYIRFNPERSALQLLGCNRDGVLATLVVQDSRLVAVLRARGIDGFTVATGDY